MLEIISLLGSLASIILFIVYVVGRGITIIMVERLWKDKIYTGCMDYSSFSIVDSVGIQGQGFQRDTIQGVLVSKEGIRNLRVFNVKEDRNRIPCVKGEEIYKLDFLNIDEALAFYVETGELFPALIIEYEAFDYMKVRIEWRDNLKSGVHSEEIRPRHTVKSFLYYFCR